MSMIRVPLTIDVYMSPTEQDEDSSWRARTAYASGFDERLGVPVGHRGSWGYSGTAHEIGRSGLGPGSGGRGVTSYRPSGIRARGIGGEARGQEAELARQAYQYWRGEGLTNEQALSVIGNQRGENVLGSLNTAGGSGQFQWDATRRAQILAGTGIDVRTAGFMDQQRAARWEMEHSPDAINRVWSQLRAAQTTEQGVGALVHQYERSLNQASDIAIRMGNAERYRRLGLNVPMPPHAQPAHPHTPTPTQPVSELGGATREPQEDI